MSNWGQVRLPVTSMLKVVQFSGWYNPRSTVLRGFPDETASSIQTQIRASQTATISTSDAYQTADGMWKLLVGSKFGVSFLTACFSECMHLTLLKLCMAYAVNLVKSETIFKG